MTSLLPPMCAVCAHLLGPKLADGCDAFPTGIPRAILIDRHDHRIPYRGDGGVLFAVAEGANPEFVEAILGGYDDPTPKNPLIV